MRVPSGLESTALIRPIAPDDSDVLVAEHSSDESRYRRFLYLKDRLTGAELHYLTNVDHHDHEALVALDPITRDGVGVARYIRDRERAEVAVAVVDAWQDQGVGTALLLRLAERALEAGIRRCTQRPPIARQSSQPSIRPGGSVKAI